MKNETGIGWVEKFRLEINADSSTCEGNLRYEIARALKIASKLIDNGELKNTLRDSNGNRIGSYGFEESEVKK